MVGQTNVPCGESLLGRVLEYSPSRGSNHGNKAKISCVSHGYEVPWCPAATPVPSPGSAGWLSIAKGDGGDTLNSPKLTQVAGSLTPRD